MGKQPIIGMAEIIEAIRMNPTVPVWPHAAVALGLPKETAYAAARRNEIEVLRFGRKVVALCAPLRRTLGLEAA